MREEVVCEGGQAGARASLLAEKRPALLAPGLAGERVGRLSPGVGRMQSHQAPLSWAGRAWGRTGSALASKSLPHDAAPGRGLAVGAGSELVGALWARPALLRG